MKKLTLQGVGRIDIGNLFVGVVADAPSILYCRQQDKKWFLLRNGESPKKIDEYSLSQLKPFGKYMIVALYRPYLDEYQIWYELS